jgi:hypothetical protein
MTYKYNMAETVTNGKDVTIGASVTNYFSNFSAFEKFLQPLQ